MVDFPTPPLPDETAIIFLTPGIGLPFILFSFSFTGAFTIRLTLTLDFS